MNPILWIDGKTKDGVLIILNNGHIMLRGKLIGIDEELPKIIKESTKELVKENKIKSNSTEILDQIEYTQEVLDRCKEIITDKNEINKLNKLYVRINTVNDITYDIMSKIEELRN